VDVSLDDFQQDCMVNVVKASFDVSLDKPDCPFPTVFDLEKCRVATSIWSKTVGSVAEPLFVVWF
jgi:hypothetical protein